MAQAPQPVKSPKIVYKGMWPDPDPKFVRAILDVAGKEVWAEVGQEVEGATVREIREDAVILEFGGARFPVPREKTGF